MYLFLTTMQGVFYLGGLMLGCSLIVFLLEAIWFECSYRCVVLDDEGKKAVNNEGRSKVINAWDDMAFKANHQKDPKR